MANFVVSDSGAPYNSIAAAYAAAAQEARDTGQQQNVVVEFGEYDESFTMDTDGVNLISAQSASSIQPVINGIITIDFAPTAYVSPEKKASIVAFKIQQILFVGSSYQNVAVTNSNIENVSETPIVVDNTGLSPAPYYAASSLTVNTTVVTCLSASVPVVDVQNGLVKVVQSTVSGAATGVSFNIEAERVAPSTAQVGADIYDCTVVGRFVVQYAATPTYYTLTMSRSNVTTSEVGNYPIIVTNGKIKVTYTVLANAFVPYPIQANPQSVVTFQNLTVPANSSGAPSEKIARSRIAADRAGGIVLNNQSGYMTSLVGTASGQVLAWSSSQNSWVASSSSPSDNSFPLMPAETISINQLVAIDFEGKAVVADASVEGRYPAVGICVAVVSPELIKVSPQRFVFDLVGMTPQALYYLGNNGQMTISIPVDAKIAQYIATGVSDTEVTVSVDRQPVYL